MTKRSNVFIFWVNLLIIISFGFPLPSAGAQESCLPNHKDNCCTLVASKCADIDLVSYAKGNGDVSCQQRWPNGGTGKVCCVGARDSVGRCLKDISPIPETPETLEITVVNPPPKEQKLPSLEGLIKKIKPVELIGNIIKSMLGLAGTLTIIMMVYAGLLWMTASGNETTVAKAKKIITWTVIGLVVIFASHVIMEFLFTSLGA